MCNLIKYFKHLKALHCTLSTTEPKKICLANVSPLRELFNLKVIQLVSLSLWCEFHIILKKSIIRLNDMTPSQKTALGTYVKKGFPGLKSTLLTKVSLPVTPLLYIPSFPELKQ